MVILKNKYYPTGRRKYRNLFGVLFIREGDLVDAKSLNHEMIHTAQIQEFMTVGFLATAVLIFFGYWWVTLLTTLFGYYICYGVEKLVKRIIYGKEGYLKLSFEREAYINESDFGYLDSRKSWAWLEYL